MSSSEAVRPDTEIKVYMDTDDPAERQANLEELERSFNKLTVLRLVEDIRGNVFNKPYPFITFRQIPNRERLPLDLEDDGDDLTDYFFTVYSLRNDQRPKQGETGVVFMGFKVTDNDRVAEYDATWIEWSGVLELLRSLVLNNFDVRHVHVLKANAVKPDLFKYIILIELVGQNMVFAKNVVQNFRLSKMSGYVAVYLNWEKDDLGRALRSNESLKALVYNLAVDE